ncbi:hypothetical protein [Wenzhouxiangella limi]|uniref:Uncharacterized protein n=1 Tax=Wenzhouxiangella limi TaxID=2707351 RepID=A0A845UXT4_9GAMM|nr:hypothetical protein [Wenzhouxiangella limi]NDY95032.1 hypothetical protein [Wenzhouxiangella limi]
MTIEHYFRELQPPAGGFERLKARLAQSEPKREWFPRLAVASFASIAVLVALLWPVLDKVRQERQALAELETIFMEARMPPLMIDGKEPVRLELQRDDVVAFWLEPDSP